MSTISGERTQAEAVQRLLDGLMRVNRSLRSRAGDWGHVSHDLSRGDIVTLGVIAHAEPTRPGRIAAALGVDPSVVSRQLATLEQLDLVTRGPDPRDRRAELISVTPQGRDRLREARAAMCDALAARLTGWDPDTIAGAAAVIDDLADLLQDPPQTEHATTSKEAHA